MCFFGRDESNIFKERHTIFSLNENLFKPFWKGSDFIYRALLLIWWVLIWISTAPTLLWKASSWRENGVKMVVYSVVTVYATLGQEAVEYALKEVDAKTVFTSENLLPKVIICADQFHSVFCSLY